MRLHPGLPTLLACAMASAAAPAAEPPSWPGLGCTVVAQSFSGMLRLQLRFDNAGAAAIELPPGPHLVLYADSDASDALETTARLDRVQRTPMTVPAGGSRVELFAVDALQTEAMRCPARPVAAAGLYFYRFSPRPQSRCRLEGYDAAAGDASPPCTASNRSTPP